jgi:MFS family permease
MESGSSRVTGTRWIVLLVYMAVVAMNQLMWITFAPITIDAGRYFGVSDLSIGLLSMIFMIVFILAAVPASWMIDRFGIRTAVGIGAALTGVFGVLRGVLAPSFGWVFASQVGIALGQPLVLNALTTVAARWFPERERATASGLGSLAMYLGILVGLWLTPYLTIRLGIAGMLTAYGMVSAGVAVIFFIFVNNRPPYPSPAVGSRESANIFSGFRRVLRRRDMRFLLAAFFIGLGVFNAVTTWIENIVRPRGFSVTQAGAAGGIMIAGGILGALILPLLSDRTGKRIPFLILGLGGSILGLAGVIVATRYTLLLASAAAFGFFLLSAGPVGFQYGAEVTSPEPEGTSNGLLLTAGQISGILFIFGMDAFKSGRDGSMTIPLAVMTLLMGVSVWLCGRLKEPRSKPLNI